jgi:hypothetical protein
VRNPRSDPCMACRPSSRAWVGALTARCPRPRSHKNDGNQCLAVLWTAAIQQLRSQCRQVPELIHDPPVTGPCFRATIPKTMAVSVEL